MNRALNIVAVALVAAGSVAACTTINESEPVAAIKAAMPTSATGALPRSASATGATLTIVSPKDGDVVSSPVQVVFGLEGMDVSPAGSNMPNAGHHHLVINADLPAMTLPIPADDNYRHFGGGQTEASIELPAGVHTLQLLLGDYLHIPHDPPVISEAITITVE